MSCDTTMYALKPVVSIPRDIYKPKTMYAIKNINGLKQQQQQQQQLAADHTNNGSKIVSDITEQVIKFLKVFNHFHYSAKYNLDSALTR